MSESKDSQGAGGNAVPAELDKAEVRKRIPNWSSLASANVLSSELAGKLTSYKPELYIQVCFLLLIK
jgi:hypothetical protein